CLRSGQGHGRRYRKVDVALTEPKTASAGSNVGPLSGLVVADISRVLAGPYLTMTLGDLGAEVVKVERPETGDDTRQWGPPWSDDGLSTYFVGLNRNRKSIALDFEDGDDLEVARDIAHRADVLV